MRTDICGGGDSAGAESWKSLGTVDYKLVFRLGEGIRVRAG
jgi:hypothetical protein